MEIRVVDFDGSAVPAGHGGRLQVRGPFLFVGYAERLDMTRARFDGDWFDTGDLALVDEDGYLRISGRTKDVIIRGGENIPVAYVENVLYEHPGIAGRRGRRRPRPAPAGAGLRRGHARPGRDGFTFEEMQAFLDGQGGGQAVLARAARGRCELPSTASGKIQKFQLRAQLQGAG